MAMGMLPHWKDEQAPTRLKQLPTRNEYSLDSIREAAYQKLLQEELAQGIVTRARREDILFINQDFMVPKKGNKWRKVVDLRRVNEEQEHIHFRMDGPEVVQDIALEGDWATSLDLKNAFHHVRVHPSYSPFLGFVHRGQFYRYTAMPFGARHSPRIFTRALGYAMAYIRAHWQVRIIAYMDDILILHQDRQYLEISTLQIASYLRRLGWTLALEKCEFTPQHEITFLGWRWCFLTLTLRMTAEMRSSLLFLTRGAIQKAERGERVPCRRLGSLIGCLNFLRSQIPRASLYLRGLHSVLAKAVSSSGWNGYVVYPTSMISELSWWWRNLSYNTPYEFRARLPQALMTTDASEIGWGAEIVIGALSYLTFGSFSKEDASSSSNRRETMAVLRALLYFRPLLKDLKIRALSIRSDNLVTVFNLQRQGASLSLLNETRQIFSLLTKLDVRILVSHVPGVENGLADSLSRMDAAGDYELKTEVFQSALRELCVQPTIDLFANNRNRKCGYFLVLPGPLARGARALDALRYSWKGELPYAFPPVQIIPRVLQHLREEAMNAVIVVPEWYTKAWWNLLQGNIAKKTILGKADDVLLPGPTMAARRAKLPPGSMIMAVVSYPSSQTNRTGLE
jgi:hypothetical protein